MKQCIAEYPTISNEKLEEYLAIWSDLIERGYKSLLDITLTVESKPPYWIPLRTITFGEDIRQITFEQSTRVFEWLEELRKGPNDE